MFKTDPISTDFLINEDPALRSMKDIEVEAHNMRQTVQEEFEQAGSGGGKSFLKGLNAELGKRSTLGQFAKLAAGGGAIAAVAMVGSELEKATKQMADMFDQMRAGKATVGEFWQQFAEGLPVLGSFYQAGEHIREMLTGEEYAAQRAAEQMDALIRKTNEAADAMEKMRKERIASQGIDDAVAQSAKDELALLKAGSDDRKRLGIEQQFGNKFSGLYKPVWDMQAEATRLTTVRDAAGGVLDRTKASAPTGDENDPQFAAAWQIFHERLQLAQADFDRLSLEQHAAVVNFNKMQDAANEAAKPLTDLKRFQLDQLANEQNPAWLQQQDIEEKKLRDSLDFLTQTAGPPSGLASRNTNKQLDTLRMMQLPNPISQAEELFGPKSAAGSGPPEYVTAADKNTSAVEDNTAALQKVNDALLKPVGTMGPPAPAINVVEMP